MFNRYNIKQDNDKYIIIDKFKLFTFLTDKRYTHVTFDSFEQASGYLYAKTGGIVYGN